MRIYTRDNLSLYVGDHLTFSWNERYAAEPLMRFLCVYEALAPNVCCLLGLRYTGKTTLMLQMIRDLDACGQTALIIGEYLDKMDDLKAALGKLLWADDAHTKRSAVRYVFIDDITRIADFAANCPFIINDVEALKENVKIVIAGDNEFTMQEALDEYLSIGVTCIDMSYVSFAEYQQLLSENNDVASYCKSGGVISESASALAIATVWTKTLVNTGYLVEYPNFGYIPTQASGLRNRVILQILKDSTKNIWCYNLFDECWCAALGTRGRSYKKTHADLLLWSSRKDYALLVNTSESDIPKPTTLNNKELVEAVENDFEKKVVNRLVVYMGDTTTDKDGVIYMNAAEFLLNTADIVRQLLKQAVY